MKPQKDFKYLKEFKDKFPITERTVFVFKEIYSNYEVPKDILIHEKQHLKQQIRIGAEKWIISYLKNPQFRLKQEIEAYVVQLESFKDRNEKASKRIECAKNLSSDLYGNLLNYSEAYKILT